eukprot:TRINITY_DN36927_c0_g1_i1.p2 TRINITY_DN36927_c0_g1~~TRINITY_DN36927_c0_g1_i1.p2  ORF type:complete len:122 (-),score=11.72 TRINITY_DN36927_c0_g1_i1:195-560(-)
MTTNNPSTRQVRRGVCHTSLLVQIGGRERGGREEGGGREGGGGRGKSGKRKRNDKEESKGGAKKGGSMAVQDAHDTTPQPFEATQIQEPGRETFNTRTRHMADMRELSVCVNNGTRRSPSP